jgi:methyltransferase, FkbM family
MNHHPIYTRFERKRCIGTGRHVFDFLGVATDCRFKKGWEKHALGIGEERVPNYPPVNEHYFDWIALLTCVSRGYDTFRMGELGAGWAPWLVRAAFATRQNPRIKSIELLGVEADPTHYLWMRDHFLDNGLNPNHFHLLHGAVAPAHGTLRFPKILNPDEDYGASIRAATNSSDYIEVPGYTLFDLLDRFSGPVDFLHMDIQGAEYDVVPAAMGTLKARVKAIMIGTHISNRLDLEMKALFLEHGWKPEMIFPRNEEVITEYGIVKFGDGFQFWVNPNY